LKLNDGARTEGFSECSGEKKKPFEDGFCPEAFFEARPDEIGTKLRKKSPAHPTISIKTYTTHENGWYIFWRK
jgi:hypothetical protein